jgi:hypothetical protein
MGAEALIAECFNSGQDHRKIFRLAACHDSVDRDFLSCLAVTRAKHAE